MMATMGFIDPFRVANYIDGRSHFDWSIVSATGGLCPASNGMALDSKALSDVQDVPWDYVIVSSSWSPEKHGDATLLTALRQWSRKGSTLGALDTGAFILAKAGLLNGQRATVHYEHIDAMKELYPTVECTEDLFVFDGNIATCCGGSASIDFALHILRTTHGDAMANAAARYMFHQSLRPIGSPQNPSLIEPLGSTTPPIVKHAIAIMEQNLEEPISIPEICSQVEISQRQLDRLFKSFVKKTPKLYYRDIRLDRARGLVTQTDMLISEIAVASGFSSQVHFSRAYREIFGLSPSRDRIEGRVPFEYRAWPMHRKTI